MKKNSAIIKRPYGLATDKEARKSLVPRLEASEPVAGNVVQAGYHGPVLSA